RPASVHKVHCLFPCPWPKKRHAKHRLFSADFLKLVNSRLVEGGRLWLVTDHRPYADWIAERLPGTGFAVERRMTPPRFGTKFEKKWLEAGQQMFDELVLSKVADAESADNGVAEMKTYFLEKIDPALVEFGRLAGPVSVQFKDFMFDAGRERGMVQAVVTEHLQSQYLWITVHRTSQGWCLAAAAGNSVLPTTGVQQAMELARDAFLASALPANGRAQNRG
ncbi:MAG: hypothetical protein HGA80_08180, partial [Candidatus Omnitrophica bacterium]|nr:hypothetical protein [Candidatus Omnitrophota bacterium]